MQADYNTPYGIIYKATAPNGKAYIGQTVQPLAERRRQHQSLSSCRHSDLANAIQHFGSGTFQWQEIACATNIADLNATEIALIAQHQTLAPNGYNLTIGGNSRAVVPVARPVICPACINAFTAFHPKVICCSAACHKTHRRVLRDNKFLPRRWRQIAQEEGALPAKLPPLTWRYFDSPKSPHNRKIAPLIRAAKRAVQRRILRLLAQTTNSTKPA